jgi:predicted nucleotidyltransferase component of viral defense system
MLASHAGVADQGLLEQDIRLHTLLEAVTGDPVVGPWLVFKGGTCLIKCYLDYPRFSSDLDFAWLPVEDWDALGTKELRRALRPLQRTFIDRLKTLAEAEGLHFDPGRDVQYGLSNRTMTFVLRYESVYRLPSLIKLQVSFAERLLYPVEGLQARGLLGTVLPQAMALLDSNLPTRYSRAIPLKGYDAREILSEKGLAVLTRQVAKTRDLVDLFLLETSKGLRIEDYAGSIEQKTRRAVECAERYQEHLKLFASRSDILRKEDVRPLLLRPLDEPAFEAYRSRAISVLGRIAEALSETHGR